MFTIISTNKTSRTQHHLIRDIATSVNAYKYSFDDHHNVNVSLCRVQNQLPSRGLTLAVPKPRTWEEERPWERGWL